MTNAQDNTISAQILNALAASGQPPEQTLAACHVIQSLVEQIAATVAMQAPGNVPAPRIQPHWGERPLSLNERNAIDALVFYQADRQGVSPRDVEEAAELAFNVPELTQLKAWEYDSVMRFLVDFEAAKGGVS